MLSRRSECAASAARRGDAPLAWAYSLVLRLRDAGLTDELIAECLAMEREALGPLLDVAEAKLVAILGGERAHELFRLTAVVPTLRVCPRHGR